MAQVKFYRGLREKYNAGSHADGVYFATDTAEILLNDISYGLSDKVITNITYDKTSGKLTFVTNGAETPDVEITIPEATAENPGLMSSEDKDLLNKVLAGMDGDKSIKDQITEAVNAAKGTIDAYTVNGQAISTNPVLAGNDLKVSDNGYVKQSGEEAAITADDTIDVALGKLEQKADNNKTALEEFKAEKNQPNGFAGLDENGKIDPSLVAGVVGHVLGLEQFVESTALPTADATNVGKYYFVTDTNKIAECVENEGAYSWEYTDPQSQILYNRRGADELGRTNTIYRWDGANMTVISDSVVLGETTGTAYDGAKGKANRDALNSAPTTVVTGFGAVTPAADTVTVAFRDSDKNGENNQYAAADGGTIVINAATDTAAGVMSATDKTYIEAIKDAFGEDVGTLDILLKSDAGVGVLKDYTQDATGYPVAAGDTIAVAIGKLDKVLTDLAGDGSGSVADQIKIAINNLINGASEGYDTLKELEDAIKAVDSKVGNPAGEEPVTAATGLFKDLADLEARVAANEAKLATVQGEETVDGSIKKALKDAKDYTDAALAWVEV